MAPVQEHINKVPELSSIADGPAKLLQLSRSTPMVIGAVVGHKRSEHVDSNIAVSRVEPLSWEAFHRVQGNLAGLAKA